MRRGGACDCGDRVTHTVVVSVARCALASSGPWPEYSQCAGSERPPSVSAHEALVAESCRRAVLVNGHPRQRPLETNAAPSTALPRSCGPEASVGPGSGRDPVGVETSLE